MRQPLRIGAVSLAYALMLASTGTWLCSASAQPTSGQRSPAEVKATMDAAYAQFEAAFTANDLETAVEQGRLAYQLATELYGTAHESTATLAMNYASVLQMTESPLAHAAYRNVIAIYDDLHGPDSIYHVRALMGAAMTLEAQQWEERAQLFRAALAALSAQAPDDIDAYASLAIEAASALATVESGSAAGIEILEDARKRVEREDGKDSDYLIDIFMIMGKASADFGDPRRQQRHYRRALDILRRAHPQDRLRHADLSLQAGMEMLHLSQSFIGDDFVNDAYETYHDVLGEEHEKTALASLARSEYDLARLRYGDAEKHLLEAIGILQSRHEFAELESGARTQLARIYISRGDDDLATEHLVEAGRLAPPWADRPPLPIVKFAPEWPGSATSNVREAAVVVEYTVDESGFVTDPVVVESVGPAVFRDAAIESARRYRYVPRFVGGEPVATPGVQTLIRFELE